MPFELIKPNTNIDFIRQTKWGFAISTAILLTAGITMLLRDPPMRLGIDFTGGMEMQLRFEQSGDVDEGGIRAVLAGFDLANADVVRLGEIGSGEYLVRMQRDSLGPNNELVTELQAAMQKAGARAFLEKPFAIQALQQALLANVGRPRPAEAEEAPEQQAPDQIDLTRTCVADVIWSAMSQRFSGVLHFKHRQRQRPGEQNSAEARPYLGDVISRQLPLGVRGE